MNGEPSVCPTLAEGNKWSNCYYSYYIPAQGPQTHGHVKIVFILLYFIFISFHLNSLEQTTQIRSKRETDSSSTADLMTVHTVPLDVPFYLSCPIDSYHASYTWEHRDNSSPCQQMQSNCLHLIPAMAQENYGIYKCVSKEKAYEKVVKQYELKQRIIRASNPTRQETEIIIPLRKNDSLKVASEAVSIILGLAVAGLTNCYFNFPVLSLWNLFLKINIHGSFLFRG